MGPVRKWMVAPAVGIMITLSSGCHGLHHDHALTAEDSLPRELNMVTLPDYRVAPPDILLIEAVKTVPKPPYRVEPQDVLFLQLAPALPDEPLSGLYSVEPDGTVNLGAGYHGTVRIAGMTVPEVKEALEKHVATVVGIKKPVVTVAVAQSRAAQRVSGPHLIRPDGSISLGTYGSVTVAGMTLAEVRKAVEAKLSDTLLEPEVTVDVQGFNSKIFYVIYDGGGIGQTVIRLPVTGNETVLDAVAQLYGLPGVSSKDRIWVSRPAPAGCPHQILPVDWRAVSECGDTTTNYQLMPGDRVYVAAYPLVGLDNRLARIISPVERLFGITLLGSTTINTIRTNPNLNTGSTVR